MAESIGIVESRCRDSIIFHNQKRKVISSNGGSDSAGVRQIGTQTSSAGFVGAGNRGEVGERGGWEFDTLHGMEPVKMDVSVCKTCGCPGDFELFVASGAARKMDDVAMDWWGG